MDTIAYSTLCLARVERMAWVGEAFLWVALLFALIAALFQIVAMVKGMPPPADKITNETGGGIGAVVEGATKLLEALSKAPPWLAMLAAGAGLIWLASSGTLLDCRVSPPGTTAPASDAPASGTPSPAAPPAGNPGAKAG